MQPSDRFHTRTQVPYSILLNRVEWLKKREDILKRDNYTCRKCGCKKSDEVNLHVHHMFYIVGFDPWEYNDQALVTVCEDCHNNFHANNHVPIFMREGAGVTELHLERCTRCGGYGWIPEYRHVANGICFRCHGVGYDEYIDKIEKYSVEHHIEIKDIDYGYRNVLENYKEFKDILENYNEIRKLIHFKLPDNITDVWVTDERFVTNKNIQNQDERKYAEFVFSDGLCETFLLDNRTTAELGDKLNIETLLFRLYITKDNSLSIIIKGDKLINSDTKNKSGGMD